MCDSSKEVKYIIRDEADRQALEAIKDAIGTSRAALNNGKVNGGEVFTPHWCVVDMCNMAADKIEDIDATIFEPACGSGNILVDVLRRKMATVIRMSSEDFIENSKRVCKSIYGVDISKDNVAQCRERILLIIGNVYRILFKQEPPIGFVVNIEKIVNKNIVWGDVIKEQMWNVDGVEADESGLAKTSGVTLKIMNWQTEKMETLDGQSTLEFLNASENDSDEVDDF